MTKNKLKEGVSVRIPYKLDLDDLLVKQPITDETLLKCPGLKDKIAWVLSTMSVERHGYSIDWGRSSSRVLQSMVKEYSNILLYLNDAGVIKCDRQYIVGERCRTYKTWISYGARRKFTGLHIGPW